MAPAATSMIAAITALSPPIRNVSSVAELVAHPGQALANATAITNARPAGRHSRLKPVRAVSPVASV